MLYPYYGRRRAAGSLLSLQPDGCGRPQTLPAMTALARAPLEAWIARRIGLTQGERPDPARLQAYQLQQLNHALAATQSAPFYQRQWQCRALPQLRGLDELPSLPFTTEHALRRESLQLLTVSQGEVARVVTLRTSGTTGAPKRLYFSADDLACTIDFFEHGMATLVGPGQRVLILLPGELPDSVGDLLRKGLARLGVTGIVYGPVCDPAAVIQLIHDQRIDSLVGIPAHVLSLARHASGRRLGAGVIRSVLLSTDYVPGAIVDAVRRVWACEVFQHYGMTEMGYGGGVSCAAHAGYHLREADLLFEIVDPGSGQPVADGQMGEVVFTTLTRRTMPLIRYRTGDLASWITTPCPCGSVLRRLGWVQGRRAEAARLADGTCLDLKDLDEALFALEGVIDFQACLKRGCGADRLCVTLFAFREALPDAVQAEAALRNAAAVERALTHSVLVLDTPVIEPLGVENRSVSAGTTAKRKLVDQRTAP